MFGKNKAIEEIEDLKRINKELVQENNQLKAKLLKYEPLQRKKPDTLDSNCDELKAKIIGGKKYSVFISDIDKERDKILNVDVSLGNRPGSGIKVLYSSVSISEIAKRWKLRDATIDEESWNRELHRGDWDDGFIKKKLSIHVRQKTYFQHLSGERMWSEAEIKVIEDLVFEKFNNFAGFHHYWWSDASERYCNGNNYIPNIPNLSVDLSDPY